MRNRIGGSARITGALGALLVAVGCGGGTSTTRARYAVAYDANGGSGAAPVDAATYEPGQAVTVLGNTGGLARSGFAFAGWNTQAGGAGVTYAPAQTFAMGEAALTLYARWIANPTFSVTYDDNRSEYGFPPVDPARYEQGQVVTVLGNTAPLPLAMDGSWFTGWNTLPDGSGVGYLEGQTFEMGPADVTLYADWSWSNRPIRSLAVSLFGIAVDAGRNVYVGGGVGDAADGASGPNRYFLTRFDRAGTPQFTRTDAGTGTAGLDVAVDANGEVYLVGRMQSGDAVTGLHAPYFLAKFDASGRLLRTATDAPLEASKVAMAFAVAVSGSGDVFVGGRTQGGLDGNQMISTAGADCFLARYDPAGDRLFTRHFGAADAFCTVRGLAVAPGGEVYAVSSISDGTGGYSLLTAFDAGGTQRFARWHGLPGGFTAGHAVAVDASGDVYVVGETDAVLDGTTLTETGAFLVKYDASGARRYVRQGDFGPATAANGVAIAPGGDVFVSGAAAATATGFVRRFDPAGAPVMTRTTLDLGRIAVDARGNLYGVNATITSGSREVLKFAPGDLLP